MNIATIVEVARKSGFMNHCIGVTIEKFDGNRWCVRLIPASTLSNEPNGIGATPEEALAACVTRLTKWVSDRQDRALRDKHEADELARMIEAAKEARDAQA